MAWGATIKKNTKIKGTKATRRTSKKPRKPNGIILTVDTREKRKTFSALKRENIPYVLETLPSGDLKHGRCLGERKTVGDLIQSINTKGGKRRKESRFLKQMDALSKYCDERDMIPYLFVSGNLNETEKMFKMRGYKLNRNSIIGALASASVRYGVHVFAWFADDDELVRAVYSVFTKVHEGKYMLPHRARLVRSKNRKVSLWSTIFRTTPNIARQLIKKYKSLDKVLETLRKKPIQLEFLRGVGPGTVKKWKSLLL